VGLGPTTVVRLESTLAHEDLRYWSGPGGLLSAWAAGGRPQWEARGDGPRWLAPEIERVTGMRKRPTGRFQGTRARTAGSNQPRATRHTEGCQGANITHDNAFRHGHAGCEPPISPARAQFGPFRLPGGSAVVNVRPRPIPCPQVVDNYVDKAQCWTQAHDPCDRAAPPRPSKGMWDR
jgi:hypothetical protein